MRKCIYITYCSKQKIENEPDNSTFFLPSKLYTSYRIQMFVRFCENHGYTWAIFSDLYGLVSENEEIKWYDKGPDCVTDEEYDSLLKAAIKKLKNYNDIIFFYKVETFHSLYRKLVNDLSGYKNVELVDELEDFDV